MTRRKTLKQILVGLMSGVLILSACRQVPVGGERAGTVTPVFVIQAVTVTPSPMPTSTNTLIPTPTPTASITPLSPIPTFTPTFDASTIVTVTPAPKAECPKEDNSLRLDFKPDDSSIDVTQDMLKYLNQGGSTENILSVLPPFYYPGLVRTEDLTGDGIAELAYIHYGPPVSIRFHIFTCMKGKYMLYQNESANNTFYFYGVYDMNQNGIPELMVISRGCTGGGCYRLYIL
jgi:hypothetical protein